MFEDYLVRLGLSEKEAKLYLLLLRVGPSPVSPLAKRAKMKRVSVYYVLETLIDRGLIRYENQLGGRRYLAYNPECLLDFLEKEKAQLSCRLAIAKECIQKLNTPQGRQSPVLF